MSGLPRGWVEAKISDLCALVNGRAFKPTDWATSGRRIVRIQNLNNPEASFNFYQGDVESKFLIQSGQLLFAWSGTPGTSFGAHVWTGGEAVLNQHIFRVDFPAASVDRSFLKAAINQKLEELIGKAHGGAGLQHVTKGKFEETLVSLPPLPEQKRIVAKLDALNAKSARARTELARIETLVSRYKQAVLSKAFNGELTQEWRESVAHMASVKPRQLQQMKPTYRLTTEHPFDAPYELPVSWNWLTLPSLGNLDRGKSRHRPRNDPKLFGGLYPFIQTGDVRAAEQYVRRHSQTYSDFGLAQSKLWPAETLSITIAANIAETAILSYPACFPDSVVGFSPDADKTLPKYAEFFLRTAKERISQFAPATAQKNINLEILAAVRLPTAPLPEQHEIVRRIESAFAKIDRLAAEAKRALELVGRLEEAILAKAFRGELVPQDENDEPAELLLERIRADRAAAPKTMRGRGGGRKAVS